MDGSPPGSPVPGILQARTLEWVAISFSNARKWKVKVKSLSRVRLLATPGTAAYQAPPPMGFSRQEYWSGCHWKTKKLMWFDLLWSSLYCDGLGASLQYLWSVSINCKMTTMVKLTSHLSPYTVTTVLLIIFPRLCITPLWLTCLCSWLLVPFSLLHSQTSLSLATIKLFSVSMSLGFFFVFFFQILRISEIKWYLSFFRLHCLVQNTQGSPMLSQTAGFLFHRWVVFHCVCMYTHVYIPLCVSIVCIHNVYIYTYTHIYIYIYTYTHILHPEKKLHTHSILNSVFSSSFWATARLLSRRRRWHPTPVLLPGKSHGWRSLVGCSPWGR